MIEARPQGTQRQGVHPRRSRGEEQHMVDRLELALRRYEYLGAGAPAPSREADKTEELSLWLDRDVASVVEELLPRPDFQGEARWPIVHLRAGARSPERALVEALDADLVTR